MSFILRQTKTALAPGLTASFLASGGTAPYVYTVRAGGAGGTIDASTGVYTAPAVASSNPKKSYDVVTVTDATNATVNNQIMVGNALLLFCEIIQREMDLPSDHIYLWDQKIFQPTDSDPYIAVGIASCKPFANTIRDGANGWDTAVQCVNMYATIDIDILSRGPAARDRKEEVILALQSIYAQSQQEANSFYIGKISTGFINLSQIDGAAIPYRFRISVALQYTVTKTKAVDYFDTFADAEVTTEP